MLSWLKIVVNQDQELEENKETKNLHAVGSLILHIGMIINCSFDGLFDTKNIARYNYLSMIDLKN